MAGPRLHVEIGALAWERHLLPNPDTPARLRSLLRRPGALDAFYGGCVFPDWGYEGIYDDAAEDSHWPPFWKVLLAHLSDRVPLSDERKGEQVAFAMGVIVHGVSDRVWHFSEEGHICFLDMVAREDSLDHHTCEVCGEVFAHLECPHRPMPDFGRWPVALVKQVYAQRDITVTDEQLARGRLKIERQWRKGARWGWLAYPYYRLKYPWCHAHYLDARHGAAGHGAQVAAVRVLEIWRQWLDAEGD